MNASEIIKLIKEENPEILGNLSEKRLIAIIRQVFIQIAKKLEDHEEGPVRVPGLGDFKIRMIEIEKDGKKESVRRIVFRPIVPKNLTTDQG